MLCPILPGVDATLQERDATLHEIDETLQESQGN
jgi:hypothetical protein